MFDMPDVLGIFGTKNMNASRTCYSAGGVLYPWLSLKLPRTIGLMPKAAKGSAANEILFDDFPLGGRREKSRAGLAALACLYKCDPHSATISVLPDILSNKKGGIAAALSVTEG